MRRRRRRRRCGHLLSMRVSLTILLLKPVLNEIDEDVVTSSWSKKESAQLSQVEWKGFGTGVFE